MLSLELQGCPNGGDEFWAFEGLPYWQDALRLRRYDEQAKMRGLETPPIAHFLPHVAKVLRQAV